MRGMDSIKEAIDMNLQELTRAVEVKHCELHSFRNARGQIWLTGT